MRKAEIVQRIAQELACTTAQAEAAVEAILTTIKASLRQGEPVIVRRLARGRSAVSGRASAATPRLGPRRRLRPGGLSASQRASRSSRPSMGLPTSSNEPGHCSPSASNTRHPGGSCARRCGEFHRLKTDDLCMFTPVFFSYLGSTMTTTMRGQEP